MTTNLIRVNFKKSTYRTGKEKAKEIERRPWEETIAVDLYDDDDDGNTWNYETSKKNNEERRRDENRRTLRSYRIR